MKRGDLISELTEIRDKADRLITALQEPAPSARVVGDAPSPRVHGDTAPKPPAAGSEEPFIGIRIKAGYAGRCVVCGAQYTVGDAVLFSPKLKRCACTGCGQEKARR